MEKRQHSYTRPAKLKVYNSNIAVSQEGIRQYNNTSSYQSKSPMGKSQNDDNFDASDQFYDALSDLPGNSK